MTTVQEIWERLCSQVGWKDLILHTLPGAKAVVCQQPCLVSEGSDPAGFRLYEGTPVIRPWRGRVGVAATSLLRGRAPGWGDQAPAGGCFGTAVLGRAEPPLLRAG